MAQKNTLSTIFLFLVLFASLVLAFFIIKPFLISIIMAGIFAAILFPLHRRLRKLIKRNTLSAILLCLMVILLVILPLIIIISMLTTEALNVYWNFQEKINSGYFQSLFSGQQEGWLGDVIRFITAKFSELNQRFDISINWQQQALTVAEKTTTFIVDSGTNIIKNFFISIFYFLLFLFTLFFLLKDGEKLIEEVRLLSPLADKQDNKIFKKFKDVSSASIVGGFFISLLQGTLGGIGFLILGLPNPLLWGTMMAFFALIPMVGTPIIWAPAALILLLMGHWVKAIILFLFGLLVVSTIDNVLRPFILQGKSELHPLILFFSILGGLFLFGPLGIFIGPIAITFFITILHLYKTEFSDILIEQREEPKEKKK